MVFCVTILGGLYLVGLIFGGAYTWRGLLSEFYGMSVCMGNKEFVWEFR